MTLSVLVFVKCSSVIPGHTWYIHLWNILSSHLKVPWTELREALFFFCFFFLSQTTWKDHQMFLLGSRMDARFGGEARKLGFLHACFPSESFQTRPINKGPPFLRRLQRNRSSSTHAITHINQTSALHHNVYPALELWISTALWREMLSCKQIIKTLRWLSLIWGPSAPTHWL